MKEHKMRSSVGAVEIEGQYEIIMDPKINVLRKEVWKTIFRTNKQLGISDCDIAMALGMVMYELLHHSDPSDPRNVSS